LLHIEIFFCEKRETLFKNKRRQANRTGFFGKRLEKNAEHGVSQYNTDITLFFLLYVCVFMKRLSIQKRLAIKNLEQRIHVLCWIVYAFIAIFGRGRYWDGIGRANTFMFFASIPLAFFLNAFGLIPQYFNHKKWLLYGLSLILVFLGLDALRACLVIAEGRAANRDFIDHFLGPNELFIPIFTGFLLSFAYVSARNWQHNQKVIEQLKTAQFSPIGAFSNAPEKKELLPDTANKGGIGAEFFFVNTGHARKRIFYKNLLYIQGEGNYARYVTDSEKILVRISLKEVLQALPAAQFIQIHRSYIAALARIDKVEDNHVFIGSERLAVSATFREGLRRALA
jgi:LytTr DNA-binding domain